MFARFIQRPLRTALLVPALVLAAACSDDDPVGPTDPAEAVEQVRLVVTPTGGQPTTYTYGPNSTNRQIMVTPGTAYTVQATWLDSGGNAVTGLEDEFVLEIVPPAGVTFNRSATFAGSMNVAQNFAGGAAAVELFHVEEDHEDLTVGVTLVVPTT